MPDLIKKPITISATPPITGKGNGPEFAIFSKPAKIKRPVANKSMDIPKSMKKEAEKVNRKYLTAPCSPFLLSPKAIKAKEVIDKIEDYESKLTESKYFFR